MASQDPRGRTAESCPVCGQSIGRIESGNIDGQAARYYIHTDLVGKKEYCVESCGGESATVARGTKAQTNAD